MFSSTRRVCAAMSPSTSRPVAGSMGTWPEMNSSCPARSAGEYGPMAFGASAARDGGFTIGRVHAALTTLFDRRQRVQTRIRLMPPLIIARTV